MEQIQLVQDATRGVVGDAGGFPQLSGEEVFDRDVENFRQALNRFRRSRHATVLPSADSGERVVGGGGDFAQRQVVPAHEEAEAAGEGYRSLRRKLGHFTHYGEIPLTDVIILRYF